MTALRLSATVRRVFPDVPADVHAGTGTSPRQPSLLPRRFLPVAGVTLVSRASIKTYLITCSIQDKSDLSIAVVRISG